MTNRHLQKQFLALLITLFVGTAVMAANTRSETVFYSLKLISIDGRTNVNSFWLRYARIAPFRKIADIADVPHQQCDKAITVSIPAHDFVCSNHLMKNDFLSLIHANESPDINIQLQGFQGITNLKNDSTEVITVNITLAGVRRSMQVSCNIAKDDTTHYTLSGSKQMKLSDFNLVPPTKFLGLVKVKNEITINFEIKLMVQGI